RGAGGPDAARVSRRRRRHRQHREDQWLTNAPTRPAIRSSKATTRPKVGDGATSTRRRSTSPVTWPRTAAPSRGTSEAPSLKGATLDDFADVSGWTPVASGQARLDISRDRGPRGGAMRLDF